VNTWKVILATLVIFGAGVITGGLLVAHSERLRPHRLQHPTPQRAAQTGSNSAGGLRFDFLRRAQRELNLSADQQMRIDGVLTESQEHTRSLMRDEVQKTKEAFRAVLTPEQQTRFDDLLKQQQRAREQRRSQTGRSHPAENQVSSNSPAAVSQ
jgi:hypothetical protein